MFPETAEKCLHYLIELFAQTLITGHYSHKYINTRTATLTLMHILFNLLN